MALRSGFMASTDLASKVAGIIAGGKSARDAAGGIAQAVAAWSGGVCDLWLWETADGAPRLALAATSAADADDAHAARQRLEPLIALGHGAAASSASGVHVPLGLLGHLVVSGAPALGAAHAVEADAALKGFSEALAAQSSTAELLALGQWLAVRNELDRRAARRVAAVRTLPELGAAVVELAEPLFHFEFTGIYFLDPEDGTLRLVHAKGLTPREREAAEASAVERHPGEVLRTGRAVDVADTSSQDGPAGHGRTVLSRVYLPVTSGGRTVGTMGFASSERGAFDSRHREVLAFLCDIAGQTYARIVAERGLVRRGELVEATAGVVERLFAAPDWRGVAHAVLGMVGSALGARALALIEAADGADLYGIVGPQEFVWQPQFGVPWPGAGCFARLDASLRARLLRGEAVDIPAANGAPAVHAKPVVAEGLLWGVLVFEPAGPARRTPDRAERSVLRSVANAFGLAISRERIDAALRQRQKMEAVGVLASGIAHDFNNMLWPIMLYSEMLERAEGLDERAVQMLREMQQAARRASELVQQVLSISRRRDRALELVHAAEVAIDATRLVSRGLPRDVRLETDIDVDAGHLLGDAASLHQAIVHLLTNAIEAMEGRAGQIRLSLGRIEREGRAWIRLTVSDEGAGIDPATKARMFEPYFSTRSERGSAGLGLSFVQRVVGELEGRIAVESEEGRGATFVLLLPMGVERSADPAVEELARSEGGRIGTTEIGVAEAEATPIDVTPGAPTARGSERVLFVDDDPSVLDVGRQMLESLGYAVTVCPSALPAVDLLADPSNHYDLLLTDLTMPGMTGIELAREARKLRPTLPIVCCTGFGDAKTERRALEAGMNAFVRKPIDFDTFAATIRGTIDRTLPRR